MAERKKDDVSGLTEAQYEPGSGKRVLKNLLGIKKKREMDRLEAFGINRDGHYLFPVTSDLVG